MMKNLIQYYLPPQPKKRETLDRLLEMSHETEHNTVLPLIMEYYELLQQGHNHNYAMGKMEAHYLNTLK